MKGSNLHIRLVGLVFKRARFLATWPRFELTINEFNIDDLTINEFIISDLIISIFY